MPGPFNPRKFLQLGKALITISSPNIDEDAKIRTSIGRCYYAAFLVAMKKMERNGVQFPDKKAVHQDVKDAYMDRGLTDIGNKLDQLRELRRRADYDMNSEISMGECKHCAQLSGYTIQLVDSAP